MADVNTTDDGGGWTLVGTTWGPVVTGGPPIPPGETRDVCHTDDFREARWQLHGTTHGPIVIRGDELLPGRTVEVCPILV